MSERLACSIAIAIGMDGSCAEGFLLDVLVYIGDLLIGSRLNFVVIGFKWSVLVIAMAVWPSNGMLMLVMGSVCCSNCKPRAWLIAYCSRGQAQCGHVAGIGFFTVKISM